MSAALRYAFDFFGTLDTHEWVRKIARSMFEDGHEVHIVSAISPGLPFDNDESYAEALKALDVPFTAIHRVDHDPALKVEVLKKIGAHGFWDDLPTNVAAARAAGFNAFLVGAPAPPAIQAGKACPVCAGIEFVQYKILWPALIQAWELTPAETEYIERQQGVHCTTCGCNLRAMALGQALKRVFGRVELPLKEMIEWREAANTAGAWFGVTTLEINDAHALSPILARIPGHQKASFPSIDLRMLPYQHSTFDVVIHSDTLEHIPDVDGVFPPATGFARALTECHRVLRPGGALCFTVPTLVSKLTRSTEGRRASYHDPSEKPDPGLRVHTEFGADVWAYVLAAGFSRVEFTCIEYPAGLAITAWK